MKFLAALHFLTTIPLSPRRETTAEELAHSTVYFPLVGLIIGLIIAGLSWLLAIVLPWAVVNVLVVAALVALTGVMHLDGLSDTCDGIAGHRTVEERWQIMHDSHAGAFGVVGVALVLLVKYVSLGSIPAPLMMPALVFMPVVSRWAMVYAIFAYPYARPAGLGKVIKQGVRWPAFIGATLITFVVAVVLMPLFQLAGVAAMLGVWFITVLAAAYFGGKFAGLTGDTYGAINEIAEVSALIFIAAMARLGLA